MNLETFRAAVALALLGALVPTAIAHADRVVLEPPAGTAVQERLDDVADALGVAIRAAGHDVIAVPPVGPGLTAPPLPSTSGEMANIARQNNAEYVLAASVTPLPGQYRLLVRVGYPAVGRVEELEVNVVDAEEATRLADIVRCMLRPEGLGDDAVRLSAGDADAQARLEAERQRREAEERARREEEERARRAREEAQRRALAERERQRQVEREGRELEEWERRERYGTTAPWILMVGLDFRSFLAQPVDRPDVQTFFGALELRGGRAIPGVPGLEARVGSDIIFGAINGFTLTGGGVYLASPFRFPLFIGGGGELGLFVGTSGARTVGFTARGGPIVSWHASGKFYVEGTPIELTFFSPGGGALAIGISARAGLRF